jgi:hypothetical protein
LKEESIEDLHWVTEHPERLSKRLLERRRARKAFYSPSVGEGIEK